MRIQMNYLAIASFICGFVMKICTSLLATDCWTEVI